MPEILTKYVKMKEYDKMIIVLIQHICKLF